MQKLKSSSLVPSDSDKTGCVADRTIDIHQRQYVVVQQVDGAAPKSPQKFTPEAFLRQAANLKVPGSNPGPAPI